MSDPQTHGSFRVWQFNGQPFWDKLYRVEVEPLLFDRFDRPVTVEDGEPAEEPVMALRIASEVDRFGTTLYCHEWNGAQTYWDEYVGSKEYNPSDRLLAEWGWPNVGEGAAHWNLRLRGWLSGIGTVDARCSRTGYMTRR